MYIVKITVNQCCRHFSMFVDICPKRIFEKYFVSKKNSMYFCDIQCLYVWNKKI